ncbi:MAG: hypothetical protein GF330_01145 [Candidatus Eisenbacteria bacterium]|nr:hypothetical protein [Candidatus Eisenbacteria bacterium]
MQRRRIGAQGAAQRAPGIFLAVLCALAPIAAATTVAIAPGQPVRPGTARSSELLRDERGRLIVVDYIQNFVLGHFVLPAILGSSAAPLGGMAREDLQLTTPELSRYPQTILTDQTGFPRELDAPVAGSPALADLTGDGTCAIVAATLAGVVHLVRPDGREPDGWPLMLDDEFFAPPATGDLDGDGDREIVLGGTSGWLYAWHHDGQPLEGWPIPPGGRRVLSDPTAAPVTGRPPGAGIFGAAAVADCDGDGHSEVCTAAADGTIRLLNGNGELLAGWPKRLTSAALPRNPAGIFASPALGDLDGDGRREIVVATNAYRVYAWDLAGRLLPGWPVDTPHRARAGYGDVALGDIDGDERIDVVFATEHGFEGAATVTALAADGLPLPGWPRELRATVNAGVALGDLTGDGVAEVVVATIGGDAAAVALDGATGRAISGWPVRLRAETVNATPLLADVDGDGATDVLLTALSTNAESQTWLWALHAGGRQLLGYPILFPGDEIVRGAPSIADLDGDGDSELVVATELRGMLYVWDLDAPADPSLQPWSTTSGTAGRAGVVTPAPATPLSGPATPPAGASQIETDRAPSIPGALEPLSTISFQLAEETAVRLTIHAVQGHRVRQLIDARLPTGRYSILWDGRNDAGERQTSGIYFYQLSRDGRATTKQLLLLQ